MSFEKITENVENIQLLPDDPSLTPEQLKKEFDAGSRIIKEKFNKLVDDLNEIDMSKLETNYISAYLGQDMNIPSNGVDIIPLTLKSKEGDKLSLDGSYIVIGKGVKKVRTSGLIFHENTSNGSYVFDYISINSKNITTNIGSAIASVGSSGYASTTFGIDITDVKEGDKICLRTNTNSETGGKVRKGECTKLFVEVVE